METYDYIVIGAGSSGSVMAGRLSEDRDSRVLLLEAGPDSDNFWVNTPAGMGKLFRNERFNWGFETAPVPSLGGRSIYWPRGKTTGGSSAINGMVYMRGHPRDFDLWRERGNAGWGWDDVLPYFIRSESNERGADAIHGGDGPFRVTDPVLRHPTTTDFIEAASRIGLRRLEDLNAPPHEGVGYQQFNIRDGCRESSYTAYVKPHRHRANLTVLTGALATRIVIENGVATGVEISCGVGTAYEAVLRGNVSGGDAIVVVGLGPVGMAALMLAKGRGARLAIGIDTQADRVETARRLGLIDHGLVAGAETLGEIEALTRGGAGVTIDCSGNPRGRLLALQATRTWGRCVYIGETGPVQFDVSDDLLHRQRTIYGSWVTSVHNMDQCCEDLDAWGLHPHDIITDAFGLEEAAAAYALMAGGKSGKVIIAFDGA